MVVNTIAEMIQELWWSILKEFGGVSGMGEWWILGVRGRWCEGDMVALKSWWFMWKREKLWWGLVKIGWD